MAWPGPARPGPARNAKAVRALELWTAADTERRAARTSSGGELVRQHQRRDDALQQVFKYRALAANAEKHLAELRPMLAYTQSRLENAELQLKLGGEREQARVERQLWQAKTLLAVQDTVPPVSNIVLDKPATSTEVQRQAALASVARMLRAAGPERLAPLLEGADHPGPAVPWPFSSRHPLLVGLLDFVRLVVLPVPLLTITVTLYPAAQDIGAGSEGGSW
ncbi:hypothetical protein ACFCZ1_22075 [Streptomyces sp. NPDC056224]|uniref:hypothetical protein n=1 Tax=Streptomyces sp. NPDC056224 TaxID=3345750 RepID=UPI0035DE81A0